MKPSRLRITRLAIMLGALALLLAALCPPAPCQWGSTPEDPLPICVAEGDQHSPLIFRLGSGRYLITWVHEPLDSLPKAYYQLVSSKGEILLSENGVQPFPGSNWLSRTYFLVPDNQGGCIAILQDARNGYYDAYGQRFDSLGNRLWGEAGLPLILWPGASGVLLKDAVVDPQGYLFIAWVTNYAGLSQMYVQKATVNGERLWGEYGWMDCGNVASVSDYQQITYDGQGGVLDVWRDNRINPWYEYLFAQHLNAQGNFYWTVNGIQLLTPQGGAINMSMLNLFPDGSGGGLCVGNYQEAMGGYPKIFRVNGATGRLQWYWVWNQTYTSQFIETLQHPADGTVYCLRNISPAPYQTRLHRFNVNGESLLGPEGLVVENIGIGEYLIETSDGVEVIGFINHAPQYVYQVLRYDTSGQLVWTPPGSQLVIQGGGIAELAATSDGADGVVGVWKVSISYYNKDIYAARMRSDGGLGNILPSPPHAPAYLQRQLYLRGKTVMLQLPMMEDVRLDLFDLLGRRIAVLAQGKYPAGETRIHFSEAELPSGLYWLRLTAGGERQVVKVVVSH